MTKQQEKIVKDAVARLIALEKEHDNESAHGDADAVLMDALEQLGFPEIAGAYKETRRVVGFWYA